MNKEIITSDNEPYLKSSAKWAKVVAIIQFVLIFGYGAIFITTNKEFNELELDTLITLTLIGVATWMSINLLSFSTNMKKEIALDYSSSTENYTLAIKDLKNYFICMGLILGFALLNLTATFYLVFLMPEPEVAPWIKDLF